MGDLAKNYVLEIKQILSQARQKAYTAINFAMVEAYWKIGKRIVEEEQKGERRARYGELLIQELSKELIAEFGKGFSGRSIRQYRQFYQLFPDFEIWRALLAKLNWTHIQRILRVSDSNARTYYLKEAANNMWSSRILDRNISTLYYERLLASQVEVPVEDTKDDKFDFIKNPMVLEFLNLPDNMGCTEATFEQALLDNIQKFLLELGKGFAFVARQQLIRTETSDFYIDLVFYNYILKCFVLIDLKIDKMTHQDIGQLDMYVRMYDDLKKQSNDHTTIGILLCTETDQAIAKYSVLNESRQLFATKYMPYLPTEEELRAEIERGKQIFKLQSGNKEESELL